jgi:catechol 2,3-dioxygenase-like lactoylglutathione lyase family enzyme
MATYNHTGHVVTDLERSKRFYQEVFGFRLWYEITPPDVPTAQLTGLIPPLAVTASYLTLDGFVLELMHYGAEGDIGAALFVRDPDGQLIELLPAAYRDRLPPKP